MFIKALTILKEAYNAPIYAAWSKLDDEMEHMFLGGCKEEDLYPLAAKQLRLEKLHIGYILD